MSVGIIVLCRVESQRLKNKPIQTINERMLIQILLDHLKPLQKKHDIVLAIPANAKNDILYNIGIAEGVEVYRGQDYSPTHRIYECGKKYGFDHVVRITADDILIDPVLLERQIEWHIKGCNDYTYLKRCPEGIAGEVIRLSSLAQALSSHSEPMEYLTYLLKNERFKSREFFPPFEYQHNYRLTVDYPEDLSLLRIIFKILPEPCGTLDILNLLRKNKYLLSINHRPMVTVYTVNHNYRNFARQAMWSVMKQTYPDIEYIFYDDCSTDGSVDAVVEEYSKLQHEQKSRVSILRGSDNIGLASSCNRVMDLARGKYIMRLDSDDMLNPECVERMVKAITETDADAVLSSYHEMDTEGNKTSLVNDNPYHPACAMISKRVASEIRFRDGIKYFDGVEFWQKFKARYRHEMISDPLWCYRRHEGQKTGTK